MYAFVGARADRLGPSRGTGNGSSPGNPSSSSSEAMIRAAAFFAGGFAFIALALVFDVELAAVEDEPPKKPSRDDWLESNVFFFLAGFSSSSSSSLAGLERCQRESTVTDMSYTRLSLCCCLRYGFGLPLERAL